MANSKSRWRKICRDAITTALHALGEVNDKPTLEEQLAAIDAAYPFGERTMWPYKMWLLERRAWIDGNTPVAPGLERPCGACGVKRGRPCRDISSTPLASGEVHAARISPPSGPLFG